MTGRRLVLLRHGRTADNHARRIQGQRDSRLDDVGRAQAAEVAPVIAALAPSVLWSSDLSRAADTAAAVASATGLTVRHDARLREFSLGEREGLTHAEYAELDRAEFLRFRGGFYDDALGAEKTVAVRERMTAALDDLLAALDDGHTGVAVSHGAAIRVAVGGMLGWPEQQFHTLRGLDNCAWVLLGEHPDAGGLRLGAYNRTAVHRAD